MVKQDTYFGLLTFPILVILILLAVYGTSQLITWSERHDKIETQRAKIAQLETKIMWLHQINKVSRILEQFLTPLQIIELEGANEQIRQWKIKKFKEKNK